MNDARRRKIRKCVMNLMLIKDDIEDILLDEEDAYDSMPENLQESPKGYDSEDSIDALRKSFECVREAIKKLKEAR